jgi:NAD(P)-dependent dehydrogenase (short-subunit alcohol dehydrogenase family)
MDKNFVIIGGSKGIGAQIAKKLLSQDNSVTILSRSTPDFGNNRMTYHKYDVLSDDLTQEFLPEVIDGLVYCPGSINLKPIRSLKEEDFKNDFEINVIGAIKAIRASITGLKKSEKSPSITLFSTVAVQRGMSFHASISASKGAIEGLTRSLSAELAPTIRVNAIAPSLISTSLAENLLSTPEKQETAAQRHPLKRYGFAEDIANTAYFLMEEGTWITGQIIHVDGGLSVI